MIEGRAAPDTLWIPTWPSEDRCRYPRRRRRAKPLIYLAFRAILNRNALGSSLCVHLGCRSFGGSACRAHSSFPGNQTMPYSGSFSEQIEEISSAFPAVLDCATCRTPQPMKIDLLPSARTGDGNIIVYRCTACGAIRDRKARRAAREGRRSAARQFFRAIADVAQPAACRATLRSAAKYALRSFRCS